MTVQTEIVNLTTATTSLLNEVITKKSVLDEAEGKATAALNATKESAAAAKASEIAAKTSENTAKTQADRAKTEADRASQISGLSTVSDAIGLAALPLPDVWAPLSDSLRMITGYGRDVLVGSDVVAMMVNFSRSTTATYIGKDGLLKTAAVNEPRFEKEGLLIEGQSTNVIPWSADFSKWAVGPNTVVESAMMAAPDGTPSATLLYARSTGWSYVSTAVLLQPGEYTLSCFIYRQQSEFSGNALFVTGDYNFSSSVIPLDPSHPIGTWRRYSLTVNVAVANTTIITHVAMDTTANARIGVWGYQVEALPFASSYIPTNGAAVTRAADVAHVNLENLPIGMSLTIACENDTLSNTMAVVASAATLGGAYWGLWRGESGGDHVFDSAFFDEIFSPENTLRDQAVVQIGRFDANTFDVAVAVNGRILKTAQVTKKPVVAGPHLRLGALPDGQYPLWGHIRNLRIWLRPLSDEQLRAIA